MKKLCTICRRKLPPGALRYCSPACASEGHNVRRQAARRRRIGRRKCQACGDWFTPKRRDPAPKRCSEAGCRATASLWSRWPGGEIKLVCGEHAEALTGIACAEMRPVAPPPPGARWCSAACRQAAFRHKDRASESMTRLKRDMVGFLDQATPPRSTVERRADRERALEELRRRGFSTIPARRKGRAITARRERGLRLQQQLGAPDQAEAQVEALEAELAELKRPRRRSARQDLPEDDRLALDWLRSLARDDGISLKQLVSRLIEARRRSP